MKLNKNLRKNISSKNLPYKKLAFLAGVGFILLLVGMTVVATSKQVTLNSKAAEHVSICQDLQAKIDTTELQHKSCISNYSVKAPHELNGYYGPYGNKLCEFLDHGIADNCNATELQSWRGGLAELRLCKSSDLSIIAANSSSLIIYRLNIALCQPCVDLDNKKNEFENQFDRFHCAAAPQPTSTTALAPKVCQNGWALTYDNRCRPPECFSDKNNPSTFHPAMITCGNFLEGSATAVIYCDKKDGVDESTICRTNEHPNGICKRQGNTAHCDWDNGICPNGEHFANGACRFQQCFTNNDPNLYAGGGFFCSGNKKVSCGNTASNTDGISCTDNHLNGKCINNGSDSYCDWERPLGAAVPPSTGGTTTGGTTTVSGCTGTQPAGAVCVQVGSAKKYVSSFCVAGTGANARFAATNTICSPGSASYATCGQRYAAQSGSSTSCVAPTSVCVQNNTTAACVAPPNTTVPSCASKGGVCTTAPANQNDPYFRNIPSSQASCPVRTPTYNCFVGVTPPGGYPAPTPTKYHNIKGADGQNYYIPPGGGSPVPGYSNPCLDTNSNYTGSCGGGGGGNGTNKQL